MPKCTFTVRPIVHIEIQGEKTTVNLSRGAIAHDYKDGGLIDDFQEFLADQEIYPYAHDARFQEIGTFRGYFSVEDATKIEAWLLKQGTVHT